MDNNRYNGKLLSQIFSLQSIIFGKIDNKVDYIVIIIDKFRKITIH